MSIGKGENAAELWVISLQRKSETEPGTMRVCYAWGNTNSGRFAAPKSPRLAFGGDEMLYKLQLSAALMPGVDLAKRDPCKSFLEAFIPVVSPILLEEERR